MCGKTCTLREASACDEAHERQRTPNCVLYTESIMSSVRVSRLIHKQTGQVTQWHCFSFSSMQDQSARELNRKKNKEVTKWFLFGRLCTHKHLLQAPDAGTIVVSRHRTWCLRRSRLSHKKGPPMITVGLLQMPVLWNHWVTGTLEFSLPPPPSPNGKPIRRTSTDTMTRNTMTRIHQLVLNPLMPGTDVTKHRNNTWSRNDRQTRVRKAHNRCFSLT